MNENCYECGQPLNIGVDVDDDGVPYIDGAECTNEECPSNQDDYEYCDE